MKERRSSAAVIPEIAAGADTWGDAYRFVFSSLRGAFVAHGARSVITRPLASGLADEVDRALSEYAVNGASPFAVGAFPFDPDRSAHLVIPREVLRTLPLPAPKEDRNLVACPGDFVLRRAVERIPSRVEYRDIVEHALRRIAGEGVRDPLEKVVLARTVILRSEQPFRVDDVLEKLRVDTSSTTFAIPLPPTSAGSLPRTFVGASPELLVAKRGRTVVSHPLAGSSRRFQQTHRDREAAQTLLRSEKDLREHAMVVESVADRLAPYCRDLRVPESPALLATRSVWHLGTLIEGTLRSDDVSSLELAAALHPTPAVCGTPREAALEAIHALEPFDRGFFAGAVGWSDVTGDGEWIVAIRCGELEGNVARLYAGAGVVAGSDPEAEAAETGAKFEAMLRALDADLEERMLAIEG